MARKVGSLRLDDNERVTCHLRHVFFSVKGGKTPRILISALDGGEC